MKHLRILMTGGGTGGHIYPIIAVATELQLEAAKSKLDLEIRYLGSCGPYKILLEDNNLKVSQVVSSRIRRYFSWFNFLEAPKFVWSVIQAFSSVFWFMPDILFSKGGPGSLPVVIAAFFYRIPILIHESDAAPGLSNVIAARFARKIFTSFPSVSEYFGEQNKNKIVLVGNPVRETMLTSVKFDKAQEKRRFGFDTADPLLLVIGGSQGAQRINSFIIKNLPLLLEATQIFHQTGKANYDAVLAEATETLKTLPEDDRTRYKVAPYFENNMADAYAASDIVAGRAGAGSIFEIAAFGKPSIIIPLPESAQDHQRLNAYDYEHHGACLVVEEANLLPNNFIDKLIKILGNPEKYRTMSEAAKNFYKPEAAKKIAETILTAS